MSNSHDDPSDDPSWADVTSGLRKTSFPDDNLPADRLGLPDSSVGSPGDRMPGDRMPGDRMTDDRSAAAKAAAWASRIMTISLEMVVPGLIGYWLDTKLGTKFILMLAGFVLGFTAAIKHLLHLTTKK